MQIIFIVIVVWLVWVVIIIPLINAIGGAVEKDKKFRQTMSEIKEYSQTRERERAEARYPKR